MTRFGALGARSGAEAPDPIQRASNGIYGLYRGDIMVRAKRKPTSYIPADHGPPEPLARGDRIVEAASDRGGARRAVNVNRLELTDAQERAADQIRMAYMALTAGLFAKAQTIERVDRGAERDWGRRLVEAVANYTRWIKQAGHVGRLVLDHVVDGKSCALIDVETRWRKGQAAEAVRVGLDLYCEMEEGR